MSADDYDIYELAAFAPLAYLSGWGEIKHQLQKRGLPVPKIRAASQSQQRPRDRGGYER